MTFLVLTLAFCPAAARQERTSPERPHPPDASIISDQPSPWRQHDGFNASELVGIPVRDDWNRRVGEVHDIIVDRAGKIERVIAEVGGFLEIGGQHIAVAWGDVQLGPEMRWAQLPLQEVESDTYSLGGPISRDEDIAMAVSAWRVNELVGEYVSIEGEERPRLVADVVFSHDGKVRAVVVQHGGDYVGPGWEHVRPFAGRRGRYAYDQPGSRDVLRFEYVQLGKLSRFAVDRGETLTRNGGRKR